MGTKARIKKHTTQAGAAAASFQRMEIGMNSSSVFVHPGIGRQLRGV
jgi:hypothetical protein